MLLVDAVRPWSVPCVHSPDRIEPPARVVGAALVDSVSDGLPPVLEGPIDGPVEGVTAGLGGEHERGVRSRQPQLPCQSQQVRALVGVVAGAQQPQAQRGVLIHRRPGCVRQLGEPGRDQVVQFGEASRRR